MLNVRKILNFFFLSLIILFFLYFYITGNCLKLPFFINTFLDSIGTFIKTTIIILFKTKIGSFTILAILLIYLGYEFFKKEDDKEDLSDKPKNEKKFLYFFINLLLIINPIPSSKISLKVYSKYFPEPIFKKITNNFASIFYENRATLLYALYIAVIIRSLFLQPFYIPSSSMEPTLLVGDRLFVTKYSYGYSKHSFPFSPPILNKRIMFASPERGDVIVFKTPADNRTDYIKRLIGLPGDKIQFIDSNLYLNNSEILKSKVNNKTTIYCGNKSIDVYRFEEKLPNGKKFHSVYLKDYTYQNSDLYTVPKDHYFFLGDNRDCSKDSRYLTSVGYVHKDNLVGKAQFIFFSSDTLNRPIFNFWKCVDKSSLRIDRFFKSI